MIKKYRLFIFGILFLLSILIFSLLSCNTERTVTTSSAEKEKIVIIDAGHGGIDGGAVGVSGVIEKDINLSIALKLQKVMKDAGWKVIMTREADVSIHDPEAATVRQKKASDLKNRLALTKLYPDSIFVSIHQNTIDIPSVKGAEVYYSPNAPESKILATAIQEELNENINHEKKRTITKAGSNLYIFYRAQNTAVLVECGFLSNDEEESRLKDEEYQQRMADTIFKGIERYSKDVY